MLIRALVLTIIWLLLSAGILLSLGRWLGGPSWPGSLLLVLAIEGVGGWAGVAMGLPLVEVAGSIAVSSVAALIVIRALPAWNPAGHAAWLFLIEATLLYLGVATVFALLVPAGLAGQVVGLLLLGMQTIALLLTLSFSFELLDVVCRRRWRWPAGRPPRVAGNRRRIAEAASASDRKTLAGSTALDSTWERAPGRLPRVVLHVPCHNEPPEIVERTLDGLARLDYPRDRYMVYVIDNNTQDAALWRPIAACCEALGFKFLHLEDWPGFKSGALNYALAATPLDAELIGVVDADYLVDSAYLRDLVSFFDDPAVAFVQTPQDYRDYGPDSTFYQRACYHAYRYFFDVSMPSRNERNAIIFGGTMGLIRAAALRDIGGWDEWCITEDAEASLRLLARGYAGRFINRSYGRGLMPLEFDALKRQRFRWCFGGIQILRKHWPALMPWTRRARPAAAWVAPGLTASQRYYYLLGGVQWYSDVVSFGFTALLLITGLLLLTGHPIRLPVLGGPLLLLPLTFWVTSLARTLWGLRATRRCTWSEALGALGVMWSLSWVVTLACLHALVRRKGVFLRTPKASRANLVRTLRSTTVETLLGVVCWGVGVALLIPSLAPLLGHVETHSVGGVWAAATAVPWWLLGTSRIVLGMLALLQGLTYLAAPAVCLLSLRGEAAARAVQRRALGTDSGEGTAERRLLMGVLAVLAAVVLLVGGMNLLPQTSPGVDQGRQKTLSSLLGNSNPAVTPTITAPATATAAAPTVAPGGTPTSTATPIATARPHGTPTPLPTAGPTPHGPHPTPTPRK